MELTVKKEEILNSLIDISGAVDKYVLITVGKKTKLSASNDILSIESSFESEIKKVGKICVDFIKLSNFVKRYPGNEITFKESKAGWLNIQGENVKLRIPGIEESLYPVVMFSELEKKINIDKNDINKAIAMTEFAIGQNIARPGMMGLCFKITPKQIFSYSADGYIFSKYKIDGDFQINDEILIPQKTVSEIPKIFEDNAVLSFSESNIQIETSKLKFRSSLLESKFPSIDSIIDGEKPNIAKIKKDDLGSYIGMFESVISQEKDQIVKFIFENNKINIESQKLDTGEGDGLIDCEYSGEKIKIGINIIFLKKIINAHSKIKNEHILFHIKDAGSMVNVTSESLPNCITGFMPVRIKW